MRIPEFKPTVAIAPTPDVRANAAGGPEAYGAGIGRGLGNLANTIARAQAEAKQKADFDRVLVARTDAGRLESMLENEARQIQGGDVVNLTSTMAERYRTGLQEIEGGLSNDDQRRAFREYALPAQNRFVSSMSDYEFRQYEEYTKQEFKNTTALEADGVARYIQEARYDEAEKRIDDHAKTVREFADKHGGDPDAAEAAWRSEVHAAAARGLFRQMRNAEAIAYYQKHREFILGDDREQLDQATASADITGRAIEMGDKLYEENGGDVGAALAAARRITDTTPNRKLTTEVEQRIRQRHSDRNNAEESRRLDVFNAADAQFRQTWSVFGIDRALWGQLSTDQQEKFMNAEYYRRKREEADADPDLTDPGALQAWMDWTHLSPQQKMDPQFDPLLTLKDRVPARLVEAAIEERALLFNPRNPNKGLMHIGNVFKRVKDTVSARGTFSSLSTNKQKMMVSELSAFVVERLQPNEDGFYAPTDVDRLIDDALIYGKYDTPYWPNPFGGPKRFRFELSESELERWSGEDLVRRAVEGETAPEGALAGQGDATRIVPYPEARADIQKKYDEMRRRQGLPPLGLTESQLLAIYNEYIRTIGVTPANPTPGGP